MRKGKQRRLRTPGTNRKVWISGALNFCTGRFHWVSQGERKNDELFMKLLDRLRRSYRCHKQLHLAVDKTTQATQANESSDTWRTSVGVFHCTRFRRYGVPRATRWS